MSHLKPRNLEPSGEKGIAATPAMFTMLLLESGQQFVVPFPALVVSDLEPLASDAGPAVVRGSVCTACSSVNMIGHSCSP